MSGEPHTPDTLPPEKVPGTHWIGGLVEQEKICCSVRIQTHSLVTRPAILPQFTVYRTSYPRTFDQYCCEKLKPLYLGMFLQVFKETIIFEKYGQMLSSALTLNPLTWKIWWAPNNASKWQMGFNSAFIGLIPLSDTQAYYMLSPENLDKFWHVSLV